MFLILVFFTMQNSLVVYTYEIVNGITMYIYFPMHIANSRVYHIVLII
jgi:hypothetical protein